MTYIESLTREYLHTLDPAVREKLQAALDEQAQLRLDHEGTIEAAISNYGWRDGIEIDADPMLSVGVHGVWVSAWLFVPIESDESI